MGELKSKNTVIEMRFMKTPPLETSRVWICTVCGAKIFYRSNALQPHYQCLCGGRQWKAGR